MYTAAITTAASLLANEPPEEVLLVLMMFLSLGTGVAAFACIWAYLDRQRPPNRRR